MKHFLLVVFVLLSNIYLFHAKKALFSKHDKVAILSAENIEDFIFRKNTLTDINGSYKFNPLSHTVVLFYHRYCGHCIASAPKFKELSKQLYGWSHKLKIGVMDCANLNSREICQQFKARRFPKLTFFSSTAKKPEYGQLLNAEKDIENIKSDLIKKLEPLENELKPIKHFKTSFSNNKGILLQEKSGFLSQQVILEMSHAKGVSDYLRWYKVPSLENNAVDISLYNGELKRLHKGITDKNLIKRNIRKILKSHFNVDVATTEAEKVTPAPDEDTTILLLDHSDHIHTSDMESAVYRALFSDVGLEEILSRKDLDILLEFVTVLVKYFKSSEAFHNGLQNIQKSLMDLSDTKEITAARWKSIMIKSKIPRVEDKWVGCQGSKPYLRGYPCGLWTTFHALTMAHYEAKPDLSGPDSKEVLRAIRHFIPRFFSCFICGQNFKKEAVNLEKEVSDTREAVLYLWRVHNRVNKRLHGSKSEDPLHIKIFWPSPKLCPGCYHRGMVSPNGNFQSAISKDIMAFLKRVYARVNWVSANQAEEVASNLRNRYKQVQDKKKKQVAIDGNVDKNVRGGGVRIRSRNHVPLDSAGAAGVSEQRLLGSMLGYGVFDMSMCVLFSVLCSVIAVMLFCMLYKGRVKRKSVRHVC